ncbi:RtcB family protein [Jeotgalibaca caeni]|uniref:RtcB family protein n=1 Tax=Jeotgalibaca caeni TaxID=3028623 RepID=UPI00237EA9C4|nr:RtcB family protein [Jeotgalibaca caeni]MDE1547794.1 RtcB family protein [Jeotgalibaca caeni]
MKSDEQILKGKYAEAKIFTTNIDEETLNQVRRLVDHPYANGSTIRIMPDTHIGKGAVVGTTMTFTDKIVPDVVGVDIGCGMFVAELGNLRVERRELERLDAAIKKHVPSGTGIRNQPHGFIRSIDLDSLYVPLENLDRIRRSLGSLGGGNHFIELNEDESGNLFLIIHSGSRSLGQQVAKFHQQKAIRYWQSKGNKTVEGHPIDPEFAYLEGDDMKQYLFDMALTQRYAHLNRKAMMMEITQAMGWQPVRTFDVVHNYLDLKQRIIRKGAISAQKGEEILIPINMRDGSILARGKGNPDWNDSAPHGAGRLLSRTQARKQLKLNEFQQAMKGIYSTSVRKATLDEAPFAYKPLEEILERTKETMEDVQILKPLYNFKA